MIPEPLTAPPVPAVYLVAIDGTKASDHVLEVACGLGAALGGAAELHVLHVIGLLPFHAPLMAPALALPPDLAGTGRLILDHSTAHAATRFRGRIVGHLGSGEASGQILQMAADLRADLVVVGTAGRTGVARLALGSVAEQVVRRAGATVMVVRPKDYHEHVDPSIEPPCVDCVVVQKQTARARLWCDRHSAHHPPGRLHYETPPSFALGSMNFRP